MSIEIYEFATCPLCSTKINPEIEIEIEGVIWNYENYKRVYRVQILDWGHFC